MPDLRHLIWDQNVLDRNITFVWLSMKNTRVDRLSSFNRNFLLEHFISKLSHESALRNHLTKTLIKLSSELVKSLF